MSPEHVVESAVAAFGIDELGRDAAGMRARRAAVAAAPDLGPTRLAALHCLTPQTVCRLAREGSPAAEVRAVRLQMGLRSGLHGAPAVRTGVREPPVALYTALAEG